MITYLCGGINGLSDSAASDWRTAAKQELVNGFRDPMRRDYRGLEETHVKAIVYGDLIDIQESDVVLVNATKPSWGTAMEIVYAYQQHKVIVAFVEESKISPWLRYHCTHIVNTVVNACEIINSL